MSSRKRDARYAGILYLLLSLVAPFGMMYVPSAFFVSGDASATAANIMAGEQVYRLGVVTDLVSQAIAVFLTLALYQLLQDVNRRHALLMVALSLVGIAMGFTNTMRQSAPLVFLSGADYLSVFDKQQLDALAWASLRLRNQGVIAVSLYWGLWLLPFGLLVWRSGFIPKIFGAGLWVAGVAYLVSCVTSLLFPDLGRRISPVTLALVAAEVPIIFYLIIRGVRDMPGDRINPGPQAAVQA
jgi:hypothetical protein